MSAAMKTALLDQRNWRLFMRVPGRLHLLGWGSLRCRHCCKAVGIPDGRGPWIRSHRGEP